MNTISCFQSIFSHSLPSPLLYPFSFCLPVINLSITSTIWHSHRPFSICPIPRYHFVYLETITNFPTIPPGKNTLRLWLKHIPLFNLVLFTRPDQISSLWKWPLPKIYLGVLSLLFNFYPKSSRIMFTISLMFPHWEHQRCSSWPWLFFRIQVQQSHFPQWTNNILIKIVLVIILLLLASHVIVIPIYFWIVEISTVFTRWPLPISGISLQICSSISLH